LIEVEPIIIVTTFSAICRAYSFGKRQKSPTGEHFSARRIAVVFVFLYPTGLHHAVSVKIVEGIL